MWVKLPDSVYLFVYWLIIRLLHLTRRAGIIPVAQMPRTGFGTHIASINNILLSQLINWLFGDRMIQNALYFLKMAFYFANVQWSIWITIIARKKEMLQLIG